MDVKDRIKLLMDSVKMSQQDFARILGITPGSLSGILNERTKPTNNHTLAIHKAFPNININWLLFGEGDMYNELSLEVSDPLTEETEGQQSLFAPSLSPELNFEQAENRLPENPRQESAHEPVKIIKRCVKEIRLFYDDGTYESFVSSDK